MILYRPLLPNIQVGRQLIAVFTIKPNISTLSRNNTVFGGFIIRLRPAILGLMKKSGKDTNVLLGRRIRSLRNIKGWTQQELGNRADINYKFLGEIERGQQNPSFSVLEKIAMALEVALPDLFRFEHEISDRKEIEARIKKILREIPDDALRQILMLLRVLYPTH